MKRLIYIISLILTLATASTAYAVTDKEMEQARVIAAQAYLRWANDGSGYLDELHPTTMAQLEKSLKPKEKENLKAFKAIGVPKDYASWNKEKLVEYWGTTVFSSKGLVEKGRGGKSRARKRISSMTVSAPAKAEEAKPKEADKPAPQAPKPDEKTQEPAQTAENPANPTASATPENADSVKAVSDLADRLAEEALENDETINKADNHTWVYIIILCILVGIVVALVVFASNTMKRTGGEAMAARRTSENSKNPEPVEGNDNLSSRLKEKSNEVDMLNKKVEDLLSQNSSLKTNLEALTKETVSLRSRLTESSRKISSLEAELQEARKNAAVASVHPQHVQQPQAVATPQQPVRPATASQQATAQAPRTAKPATSLRTIYLGRANSRGIFVRADRQLNIGNSIFRLDTSDGYAGTFRVASDPTVWEMAILTPNESLAGACIIQDNDGTEGKSKIVTDSAGTAVFEGGCWKVIRKAKVHFE